MITRTPRACRCIFPCPCRAGSAGCGPAPLPRIGARSAFTPGRWYSLVSVLLVCACAAVSGAKSLDEIAEFAERATNTLLATLGIRRHLLGWRRSPKPVTIGRVLMALDGDALD